jgi:hypothetical protein
MYKYELGNISEGIVLSAYINAGFAVSIPFGGGVSYDLIVDTDSHLYKVQVKTAWLSGGCIIYKANVDNQVLASRVDHMRTARLTTSQFIV